MTKRWPTERPQVSHRNWKARQVCARALVSCSSHPWSFEASGLRNANGTELQANDDWADTQGIEIEATGLAPPNTLESAIVTTLPSGSYTAIVQDVKSNTGVALVEVYNLR